ncbi:MAG: hypothetical protein U1F43_35435 [Myxococcota bacterium]
MHLVRLLRMGAEILRGGAIIVRRPDRDELLAVRGGALSFEALEARCAEHERDIAAALTSTTLPEEPDDEALDALCVAIVEEVLAC